MSELPEASWTGRTRSVIRASRVKARIARAVKMMACPTVDPEPPIRTSFPDQAPCRAVRPHQGEEDQVTTDVNPG